MMKIRTIFSAIFLVFLARSIYASDFTITDFDTGAAKTNTETSYDNPLLSAQELGIEPTFTDRISGGTRKSGWTSDVHAQAGAGITDQSDYLEVVQQLHSYAHIQRDVATDNITIQAKIKYVADASVASWRPSVALYWGVDDWVKVGDERSLSQYQSTKNVASTTSFTRIGSTVQGTWYWYKIKLTATNYYIYYSTNGSSWTQIETGARPGSWSGAPNLIIVGKGYSDNPTYSGTDFNNSVTGFPLHTTHITDIVVLPYKLSGNWTSAIQTMPAGASMAQTTIYHSGLDAANCIDKVEWLVGGQVKAAYETDITNGAWTAVLPDMVTSGSFVNVNADFQVKLYLVGDGSATPVVTKVEGETLPPGAIFTFF
ncbi:hypothetical protein ACFLQR_04005 [Verrucomicrobiota bacterium]